MWGYFFKNFFSNILENSAGLSAFLLWALLHFRPRTQLPPQKNWLWGIYICYGQINSRISVVVHSQNRRIRAFWAVIECIKLRKKSFIFYKCMHKFTLILRFISSVIFNWSAQNLPSAMTISSLYKLLVTESTTATSMTSPVNLNLLSTFELRTKTVFELKKCIIFLIWKIGFGTFTNHEDKRGGRGAAQMTTTLNNRYLVKVST